jgi:hypothetical protein
MTRSGLFSGRCWDHDGAGVDFGNAEVAAEMDQVERAEGTGDFDSGHLAGAAEEDGDVVDLTVLEVEPEVGEGLLRCGAILRRGVLVDEVLPAGGAEGGGERGHVFGDVEGLVVEAEVFDGDGVELAGRAFAAVEVAVGGLEHVVVEREGGVGRGLGGEVVKLVGQTGGLLGREGCGEGEDGESACGQRLHVVVDRVQGGKVALGVLTPSCILSPPGLKPFIDAVLWGG